MRVALEVVHPLRIERRRPALEAVHLVALFQQQFGQIGTVLTGYTGNERFLRLPPVSTALSGLVR
jgi:hypothetical protein